MSDRRKLGAGATMLAVLARSTPGWAEVAPVSPAPASPPAVALVTAAPDAPARVVLAVSDLKQACADWRPTEFLAPPRTPGMAAPPRPAWAENIICGVAQSPQDAFDQTLFVGGLLGAVGSAIGLLMFRMLRGALMSWWNWRLPLGRRSW